MTACSVVTASNSAAASASGWPGRAGRLGGARRGRRRRRFGRRHGAPSPARVPPCRPRCTTRRSSRAARRGSRTAGPPTGLRCRRTSRNAATTSFVVGAAACAALVVVVDDDVVGSPVSRAISLDSASACFDRSDETAASAGRMRRLRCRGGVAGQLAVAAGHVELRHQVVEVWRWRWLAARGAGDAQRRQAPPSRPACAAC